jgi:hypothetical protein
MHQFLSVCYFTLLLLHVSATSAILRELVCTFCVTCQSGFLVDKILCSMWLCGYYVAAWCVSICLSMLPVCIQRHRQIDRLQAAT